jgi:hypothetical protein
MRQENFGRPISDLSLLAGLSWSVLGASLASVAGVATVVVLGLIAWSIVRGFNGIAIAAVIGGGIGAGLHWFGKWPAHLLGGVAGGAVGGFFVIAAAETCRPGSADWAITGGLLGAGFGALVAAALAAAVVLVVALARSRKTNRCRS